MKTRYLFYALILISWACDNAPSSTQETDQALDTTFAPQHPHFLHISDIHLDTRASAITYGEDTDQRLWDSTKVKIASILSSDPAPEFIVYTGDLSGHYSCHDSSSCFIPPAERGPHSKDIATLLNDFRSLVAKDNIPLFYLPGNNDALAGDYFSFSDAKQQTPLDLSIDENNPYPALNTASNCGTPPCVISKMHETMGYYSAYASPGLRIIALNSIIWGRNYFQRDGISHIDAGNKQMAWLSNELDSATAAGDKVYLAMHIPPGLDAYAVSKNKTKTNTWAHLPSEEASWQNQFLKLTATHQKHIAGILYGHTHLDELRLLYEAEENTITEVAIAAPGITPQHHNNPGFKSIYFDPETKELTDFITYYTTPTPSVWKTYQFSDVFECTNKGTMFDCLANMSLEDVNTKMDAIYTVMNGKPTYDTASGIAVKAGQ